MESIGLRELRQHASELVRRAEAGEELVVTVSGRPAAVLGPATPTRWRRFADIAEIFAGPADPAWAADRERVDQTVGDAWLR
ncbi:MAG: type II toxin-antitoxin system prevent-host-death family antitoxin [Acidimicrobiia bacterium]